MWEWWGVMESGEDGILRAKACFEDREHAKAWASVHGGEVCKLKFYGDYDIKGR